MLHLYAEVPSGICSQGYMFPVVYVPSGICSQWYLNVPPKFNLIFLSHKISEQIFKFTMFRKCIAKSLRVSVKMENHGKSRY